MSEERIKARIKEIAQDINADYSGESVLFVGILKGSFIFLADLVREVSVAADIGFIAVSSYKDKDVSEGIVSILYDLDRPVEGKNVVIVEDIADSGLTLNFLISSVKARTPKSLKVCVLLDKPSRRKVNITPDYIGFQIPDAFVVGCGLDYAGRYRNLKGIYTVRP
ncbi:MAG: hypoxanthine phosphoribosyltransferase [Deferribacteraceae bacterium]|nr:hypoxanthine phosphoribosyltransferase [Deferribacteraceae bacterium]